jgi:CDP-ribitol ribitolphosphotransferase
MVRTIATARFVFICEACMPLACLPLRPETKVIQLWHGCGAFKRFGMSTADKIFGASREEKLRYPAHRNTSLVTVSSPEVAWAYVEAMDLGKTPDIVQPLGVSRTDVYFDQEFLAAQRLLVEEKVPQARGKKVLLYAPTFRGHIAEAEAPDALDIAYLREHLADKYVLLIKHHPFIKKRPAIPAGCEDFAFDVSDALPIETAMVAADVCVSDYSSLVFEYSLLNRPMAFFAYDKADYDDWRGFYYDYDEMTPGPVVTTTEELADWIEHLDESYDLSEVDAFREKFMSACDGHATQRIADAVTGA